MFISDLELSKSLDNIELEFLQQLKECQNHLHSMEKLFHNSQNLLETEIIYKNLNTPLNESNCSKNNSFPNLQFLMQEFETKMNTKNKLSQENDSASQKNLPIQIELHSSGDEISSPLTFMIQVPNSLLSTLKNKICSNPASNFSSESLIKEKMKSHKKFFFLSVLQKLFRNKRSSKCAKNKKFYQNPECPKENVSNVRQNSNLNFLTYESDIIKDSQCQEKNLLNQNSKNTKKRYNPNDFENDSLVTVPHDMELSNDLNTSSASKLKNDCADHKTLSDSITEKDSVINEKENIHKKLQPPEIFFENLIKTLLKIIEKLESLQAIKLSLESLNKNMHKTKISKKNSKSFKVKYDNESKTLNHLLQHILADIEYKRKNSKSFRKYGKQKVKNN